MMPGQGSRQCTILDGMHLATVIYLDYLRVLRQFLLFSYLFLSFFFLYEYGDDGGGWARFVSRKDALVRHGNPATTNYRASEL